MAAITQTVCTTNNGLVRVDIIFDNVSGNISSVTLVNNGPSGVLNVTFLNYTNGHTIWQGSAIANAGTTTINVSSSKLTMTSIVRDGNQLWVPPCIIACSWG